MINPNLLNQTWTPETTAPQAPSIGPGSNTIVLPNPKPGGAKARPMVSTTKPAAKNTGGTSFKLTVPTMTSITMSKANKPAALSPPTVPGADDLIYSTGVEGYPYPSFAPPWMLIVGCLGGVALGGLVYKKKRNIGAAVGGLLGLGAAYLVGKRG
jgi:hypothetical protein